MTTTADTTTEQVLRQGPIVTLNAGIWNGGLGVLTTQRFYRAIKGYGIIPMIVGRLLGGLVNSIFPERVDINIPLASIAVIGRGKLGLKKDVLYIQTTEGKSYQLTVDYDAWLAAFKAALEAYQHAQLNPSENERWTVVRQPAAI